jgi:hypothetical protein
MLEEIAFTLMGQGYSQDAAIQAAYTSVLPQLGERRANNAVRALQAKISAWWAR